MSKGKEEVVTPFAKIQLAAAKRAEANIKGKGKESLSILDKLLTYCFVNRHVRTVRT